MSELDVLEITSEEAVAALTAQAFHEQPGEDAIHDAPGEHRVIVHCMLDAPGMVIGADWDLADAVALCQRTDRFAWTPGPARHDLAVIADGKVYRFDVRREVTR